MLATVSFVGGIFLAAIILAVTRQTSDGARRAQKPTTLAWWTLAFGLTGILTFALAWLMPSTMALWLISIAFAFAAVLVGIGTLQRQDRHWPTWVGLFTGLVLAFFWIVFAAGNILSGE